MIDLITIPKLVIHCTDHIERWNLFCAGAIEFFTPANLNFNSIGVIDAEMGTPPAKYLCKSHKKAVQMAKDNNWPYVLIMEDDVRFIPGSFNYAQQCFNNITDEDVNGMAGWGILLGGIYKSMAKPQKINEHWMRIDEFCGTQFFVLHHLVYDRVLAMDEMVPIDRWYGHPNLGMMNAFCVNRFFALQHNGYSYVREQEVNDDHYLKEFEIFTP